MDVNEELKFFEIFFWGGRGRWGGRGGGGLGRGRVGGGQGGCERRIEVFRYWRGVRLGGVWLVSGSGWM